MKFYLLVHVAKNQLHSIIAYKYLERNHIKMSDMKASVTETKAGSCVEGYKKIKYDFSFVDNVFDPHNKELAQCFDWRN